MLSVSSNPVQVLNTPDTQPLKETLKDFRNESPRTITRHLLHHSFSTKEFSELSFKEWVNYFKSLGVIADQPLITLCLNLVKFWENINPSEALKLLNIFFKQTTASREELLSLFIALPRPYPAETLQRDLHILSTLKLEEFEFSQETQHEFLNLVFEIFIELVKQKKYAQIIELQKDLKEFHFPFADDRIEMFLDEQGSGLLEKIQERSPLLACQFGLEWLKKFSSMHAEVLQVLKAIDQIPFENFLALFHQNESLDAAIALPNTCFLPLFLSFSKEITQLTPFEGWVEILKKMRADIPNDVAYMRTIASTLFEDGQLAEASLVVALLDAPEEKEWLQRYNEILAVEKLVSQKKTTQAAQSLSILFKKQLPTQLINRLVDTTTRVCTNEYDFNTLFVQLHGKGYLSTACFSTVVDRYLAKLPIDRLNLAKIYTLLKLSKQLHAVIWQQVILILEPRKKTKQEDFTEKCLDLLSTKPDLDFLFEKSNQPAELAISLLQLAIKYKHPKMIGEVLTHRELIAEKIDKALLKDLGDYLSKSEFDPLITENLSLLTALLLKDPKFYPDLPDFVPAFVNYCFRAKASLYATRLEWDAYLASLPIDNAHLLTILTILKASDQNHDKIVKEMTCLVDLKKPFPQATNKAFLDCLDSQPNLHFLFDGQAKISIFNLIRLAITHNYPSLLVKLVNERDYICDRVESEAETFKKLGLFLEKQEANEPLIVSLSLLLKRLMENPKNIPPLSDFIHAYIKYCLRVKVLTSIASLDFTNYLDSLEVKEQNLPKIIEVLKISPGGFAGTWKKVIEFLNPSPVAHALARPKNQRHPSPKVSPTNFLDLLDLEASLDFLVEKQTELFLKLFQTAIACNYGSLIQKMFSFRILLSNCIRGLPNETTALFKELAKCLPNLPYNQELLENVNAFIEMIIRRNEGFTFQDIEVETSVFDSLLVVLVPAYVEMCIKVKAINYYRTCIDFLTFMIEQQYSTKEIQSLHEKMMDALENDLYFPSEISKKFIPDMCLLFQDLNSYLETIEETGLCSVDYKQIAAILTYLARFVRENGIELDIPEKAGTIFKEHVLDTCTLKKKCSESDKYASHILDELLYSKSTRPILKKCLTHAHIKKFISSKRMKELQEDFIVEELEEVFMTRNACIEKLKEDRLILEAAKKRLVEELQEVFMTTNTYIEEQKEDQSLLEAAKKGLVEINTFLPYLQNRISQKTLKKIFLYFLLCEGTAELQPIKGDCLRWEKALIMDQKDPLIRTERLALYARCHLKTINLFFKDAHGLKPSIYMKNIELLTSLIQFVDKPPKGLSLSNLDNVFFKQYSDMLSIVERTLMHFVFSFSPIDPFVGHLKNEAKKLVETTYSFLAKENYQACMCYYNHIRSEDKNVNNVLIEQLKKRREKFVSSSLTATLIESMEYLSTEQVDILFEYYFAEERPYTTMIDGFNFFRLHDHITSQPELFRNLNQKLVSTKAESLSTEQLLSFTQFLIPFIRFGLDNKLYTGHENKKFFGLLIDLITTFENPDLAPSKTPPLCFVVFVTTHLLLLSFYQSSVNTGNSEIPHHIRELLKADMITTFGKLTSDFSAENQRKLIKDFSKGMQVLFKQNENINDYTSFYEKFKECNWLKIEDHIFESLRILILTLANLSEKDSAEKKH